MLTIVKRRWVYSIMHLTMQALSKKPRRVLTVSLESSDIKTPAGGSCFSFSANNTLNDSHKASWAYAQKKFSPELNLKGKEALGVWVFGDGNGEILNFRLESPEHLAYGAIADHYVTIDFKGWRYFSLIETESTRHSNYEWPEGAAQYHVFRENIDFSVVESVSIWFNGIPAGKSVNCLVSRVKALPMVSGTVKNPAVSVNGKKVVFPVEMSSGSYIEAYSESDCKLFGSKGELIKEFAPAGKLPVLKEGANKLIFGCEKKGTFVPRANVTLIGFGEKI